MKSSLPLNRRYSVRNEKSFKCVLTYLGISSPSGNLVRLVDSGQSLDRSGRRGDMTNDSIEILFQSFLQEAIVSSSGMAGTFIGPAFPRPTAASSTSPECQKVGVGEAVRLAGR